MISYTVHVVDNGVYKPLDSMRGLVVIEATKPSANLSKMYFYSYFGDYNRLLRSLFRNAHL